jgi:predicted DNA-binding transcriptional regulator AlpA
MKNVNLLSQTPRRLLYPKDMMGFFGCSTSTSYRKYNKVRTENDLAPGNTVTVYHFAKSMHITVEEVLNAIFGTPLPTDQ